MLRRVVMGIAPLACIAATMGLAGTASAQTGNPFSCTASTATVSAAGNTVLNPLAANATGTPCASDTATLGSVDPLVGLLTLGPIDSQTTLEQTAAGGATIYTGAKASTTVDALSLTVPAVVSIQITQPSAASVDYECVNNQLVPKYSSTLSAITIDGNTISLRSRLKMRLRV